MLEIESKLRPRSFDDRLRFNEPNSDGDPVRFLDDGNLVLPETYIFIYYIEIVKKKQQT